MSAAGEEGRAQLRQAEGRAQQLAAAGEQLTQQLAEAEERMLVIL